MDFLHRFVGELGATMAPGGVLVGHRLGPYDLVSSFDCLDDMGDPAAAARHVRDRLAPGGTCEGG